jgi:adenosylhomocysteinase
MGKIADFHPDFLGEMCRRLQLKPYPDTRQFVVQHLFADTVRLLRKLHQYVPIETVIGISYSGNVQAIAELRAMGIRVLTPAYAELTHVVASELKRSIARCRRQQLRLVIHEVGGIAIRALHEPTYCGADTVIGALEITKQGVWVAEQLKELRIPQINVAQTRLKEIEGKQVGEAVVAALDNILRDIGYATVGRDALVCGYGWVGKGVAQSLRQRGLGVSVKDIDTVSVVEATVDGYNPCYGDRLTRAPAIVVGASGRQSIDQMLQGQLPDRCFLVSGSSRDHEIDLSYLDRETAESTQLHKHVRQCTLHDGRRLYLVNEGYPVNFTGASVPDEIVEFLFAELIMLVPWLLDDCPPPGIHTLPAADESLPASIWLEMR